MKLLLYCTKKKPNLNKLYGKNWFYFGEKLTDLDVKLNGKIVAQCDCEKIDNITYNGWWNCYANSEEINYDTFFDEINTCLTQEQISKYLKNGVGYALHLSNLEVFDVPKELSDFGVRKAPQNMCYKRYPVPFDNELGGWEIDKETIIISIKPEHLANILNGKKTIEVRKKILKNMEELMK